MVLGYFQSATMMHTECSILHIQLAQLHPIVGGDNDGDGIIDYKNHLNLIANTLLQLNVSGNQVFYKYRSYNLYLGTLSKNCRRNLTLQKELDGSGF